ncbi:carbohydrate ABC transporter permease, partial [Clostridium sp.]|uniref:carbohydrate ABC transporter permease n=1 Tax=Clostridium sp. TaxID=1506 RepID=UPI003F30CBFB
IIMNKKLSKLTLNIGLLFMSVVTVLPFIWMIFSSFKSNSEIASAESTFFPKNFTFENYAGIQANFDFLRLFGNSLFIAIAVTVLVVYTSVVCGYVLAKYRFKGRNLLFSFILATMMIPWCVTIIPRYSLMIKIGWLDSYLALIVPAMISGFGIFMLKQSISAIPDEIIEAARIDGASEFRILHKIIFPLSTNSIASIAIFQFLWSWEDYLWPYLVINSESKQLLSVGLQMFNGQYGTNYGGLFAATAISIIPVVIVYLIFQKRFIEGVAASAVKG